MSRETVSAWVDVDELQDVLDEHDLENASELLQKVAETGELQVVSDDSITDSNAQQNPPGDSRVAELEERMETFEEEAKPAVRQNAERTQQLRADIEDIRDRLERLENIAQE